MWKIGAIFVSFFSFDTKGNLHGQSILSSFFITLTTLDYKET